VIVETEHPAPSVVNLKSIIFFVPALAVPDLPLLRQCAVGVSECLHGVNTSVIETLLELGMQPLCVYAFFFNYELVEE